MINKTITYKLHDTSITNKNEILSLLKFTSIAWYCFPKENIFYTEQKTKLRGLFLLREQTYEI